jgi:hypothetical protein
MTGLVGASLRICSYLEVLGISGLGKWFRGGSICIRINDENSIYFKPGKDLRQGDPLSPLLFNLVADVFCRMLMKAASCNLVSRLLPQVTAGGIISLQYADDTILFLENDLEKASTLKWILVCFEKMSGMKINYDKSDLITIELDDDRANGFAKNFCCKKVSFPLSIWVFLSIILSPGEKIFNLWWIKSSRE